MSVTRKALESHDANDWHEDAGDERMRMGLTVDSNQTLVRLLYPFRARLLQRCVFNNHAAGHIFPYARTSFMPSMYPIQIFDIEGQTPHRWSFSSAEIEILPE